MSTRTRVALTVALGSALIIAGLVRALAQIPDKVIATNHVTVTRELSHFHEHTQVCQTGDRLPATTTALRISVTTLASIGPEVHLSVARDGKIVGVAQHDAGWVSAALTLQLNRPVTMPVDVSFCLTRGPGGMPVELAGDTAMTARAATVNGKPLPGRLRVEYLGRGRRSWLSLARHAARRLGLVRIPSGGWIVLPTIALAAVAIALAVWLLLREPSP